MVINTVIIMIIITVIMVIIMVLCLGISLQGILKVRQTLGTRQVVRLSSLIPWDFIYTGTVYNENKFDVSDKISDAVILNVF